MIVAALFIVAVFLSAEPKRDVPVTVHVTTSSCSGKLQPTKADFSPSLVWKTDTTAVVRQTVLLTSGMHAADRAPRAYLAGNELNLCYNLLPADTSQTSGVTLTCAYPEALEFTVSEVPHGDYKPYIAMCWPPG